MAKRAGFSSPRPLASERSRFRFDHQVTTGPDVYGVRGVSERWWAALLRAASSTAVSRNVIAIHNRPLETAKTITTASHCRILILEIIVAPLVSGQGDGPRQLVALGVRHRSRSCLFRGDSPIVCRDTTSYEPSSRIVRLSSSLGRAQATASRHLENRRTRGKQASTEFQQDCEEPSRILDPLKLCDLQPSSKDSRDQRVNCMSRTRVSRGQTGEPGCSAGVILRRSADDQAKLRWGRRSAHTQGTWDSRWVAVRTEVGLRRAVADAAQDSKTPRTPFTFERREPGPARRADRNPL